MDLRSMVRHMKRLTKRGRAAIWPSGENLGATYSERSTAGERWMTAEGTPCVSSSRRGAKAKVEPIAMVGFGVQWNVKPG